MTDTPENPFTGVASVSRELKLHALLFDKIAIPKLWSFHKTISEVLATLPDSEADSSDLAALSADVDWLCEHGIVVEAPIYPSGEIGAEPDYAQAYRELIDAKDTAITSLREVKGSASPNSGQRLSLSVTALSQAQHRVSALILRRQYGVDAVPVLDDIERFQQITAQTKSEVAHVVLSRLPIPGEDTSWEQIAEYRADPDSIRQRAALRRWMSEMARGRLSPSEISEVLDDLGQTYTAHLNYHRLNARKGTVEVLITAAAGAVEDLAKLRFRNLAEGAFAIRHRRIALLQAELTAPGSEVAYIVKTSESF